MAEFGLGRTIASYLWALSPLYTFGLATPFTMMLAAHAQESLRLWASQFPYMVLVPVGLVCLRAAEGSTTQDIGGTALVLSSFGGTLHALMLRRRAFCPPLPPAPANPAELEQWREERRRICSRMTRTAPKLARQLRIGRPDRGRTFQDGGLVNLNRVPGRFLVTVPGITPELVERIIDARERCGEFHSAEEVIEQAGLSPELLSTIAEYGVYRP